MTQTVLPQLKEIASDLVAQEASLAAQLEEVREKLDGVRAVLPLFGEDADESATTKVEPKTKTKAAATTKTATTKTTTKAKSTASKTATKAKKTKKKSAKKKDGRTASWQKYTRPGVKEKTVPEAVRLVLETQPDKSFKIAEVMDSLFKEGMPKQQYLKARNRISNILSGGVRDGEWYKGERGTYGLTKKK
ncbi:MAG: hypothetical protein AAF528_03400 [Cyanobacteria bacterium P01_C01_bin.121]